jgi:hypothetical protein
LPVQPFPEAASLEEIANRISDSRKVKLNRRFAQFASETVEHFKTRDIDLRTGFEIDDHRTQ